jgi:hypothetical protein
MENIYKEAAVLENKDLWLVCHKHALVRAYPYFAKIMQSLLSSSDYFLSPESYSHVTPPGQIRKSRGPKKEIKGEGDTL